MMIPATRGLTMSVRQQMILLALFIFSRRCSALSAPAVPRQFIEISNPLTNSVDSKLPSAFTAGWPTWVLDGDNSNSNENEGEDQLQRIPDSNGFVDPASIDEVWQPVDLKIPDVRLALGLHVRDGVIRHVMPSLDLSYNGKHRNRGLCSVPRAFQWADFQGIGVDEWDQLELTVSQKKNQEQDWQDLMAQVSIGAPLTAAIKMMTEQPPAELGDGSHIVNIVLQDEAFQCLKTGSEIRVILQREGDVAPLGVLQVQVSATSAGSESEYLPDCYKPLFQDSAFRREAFTKFKQRVNQRNAPGSE